MEKNITERKIEGLESFNRNTTNDISFDLYKNFTDSKENLKKYGEAFSDFYYISCAPFDKSIISGKMYLKFIQFGKEVNIWLMDFH